MRVSSRDSNQNPENPHSWQILCKNVDVHSPHVEDNTTIKLSATK